MLAAIHSRLKNLEKRLGERFGKDISTPEARRAAWWHFQLMDHAFLRVWWTNFAMVAPGVFRSNQPSPARLRRYRDMGIRTIVSLRGEYGGSPMLFETEACDELGLKLVSIRGFWARKPPTREAITEFEKVMREAEKPVLLHCKSGSDRAGVASAIYLMLFEGRPVEEAARQLSWRFIHLKRTRTGVLDHMLRVFARDQKQTGMGFSDWIETRYDREAISASFQDWLNGRWRDVP
ncbi:fused DSP-PTPase phosphatase/NAD kinase-like protein [Ostreiculturibacter nitratireducens]|uniref:fused DSP-PTPase phosphatase/NAD kinase-like protein n=1 Tax=Ostreiculturibacter nitratireducens TaxID=3075226 RepID=UPI0031B5C083